MTLSALGVTAVYLGSGSTGPFSLVDANTNPILFANNSEIVVELMPDDEGGEISENVETLTLNVDYTLTGAGSSSAGSLTLTEALASGEMLIIRRRTPLTQSLDLDFGGDVGPEDYESRLDRITRQLQELDERTERAFMFSASETDLIGSRARFVPTPAGGYVLGWNDDGDRLTNIERPNTILSGMGAPSGDLGNNGDIYIDVALPGFYYKSAGSWEGPVAMTGPQGDQGNPGPQGIPGDDGEDGQTILSGMGAPSDVIGQNGDFYIDISVYDIYGPKNSGTWPGGVSLVGPAGAGTGDFNGPGGATDNAIVRFDGTTGKLGQNSSVIIDDDNHVTGMATLTLPNTGLHILDTGGDHDLIIASGENLSADRTLTLSVGNANRSVTFAADGTVYQAGATDVALADGGTGASLADPDADRLLFWDDSAGAVTWLQASTGLSISGTVLSFSHLGIQSLVDPNADRLLFWDDSAGAAEWGTVSGGVEITGTTIQMTANQRLFNIPFIIDGGGAAITTGIKGDIVAPFGGTITSWTILGDQSGSIVVDIWKDTYANYPPTGADTITGAEKPTISAATKGQDTSLNSGSGWAFSAGDILRFNVDSVSTLTRASLNLIGTKS